MKVLPALNPQLFFCETCGIGERGNCANCGRNRKPILRLVPTEDDGETVRKLGEKLRTNFLLILLVVFVLFWLASRLPTKTETRLSKSPCQTSRGC